MRYASVVTAALAAVLWAAPGGFQVWKGTALRSMDKTLASKVDAGKAAVEQLGDFGSHSMVVVHRQGDGEAEIHHTQTDVFVVQSGAGTLVVGGEVVNGRTTGPGEIRGDSIKGGEKRPLAPGDIVNIPAKMPHQVLVQPGNRITYAIVKVNAR
jgi:mannose-6-phosphate isomerase-like protein (cupin superfamily)